MIDVRSLLWNVVNNQQYFYMIYLQIQEDNNNDRKNLMVSFLKKIDQYPFCVKIDGEKYTIGEGMPAFTVNIKKKIPMDSLITSTSIALGEAYMDGTLDIEGDLYYALNHFLGQMGKFSTDQSALKKLIFSSKSKKIKRKKCKVIMILVMIFINYGWMIQ